jgi:plastocyanin
VSVRNRTPGARLNWGIVLVAIAVVALLGATVTFALAMMSGMSGMHGRAGGGPQAPVVSSLDEVTVEIRDFDFQPRDLTVRPGARVTWVNRDGASHDATEEGDAWSTGRLDRNESTTLTFNDEGTYEYICTIHPSMKGTLRVVASP